ETGLIACAAARDLKKTLSGLRRQGWRSILGAKPTPVLQPNHVQEGLATESRALGEGCLQPNFECCPESFRLRATAFPRRVISSNELFKFRVHPPESAGR